MFGRKRLVNYSDSLQYFKSKFLIQSQMFFRTFCGEQDTCQPHYLSNNSIYLIFGNKKDFQLRRPHQVEKKNSIADFPIGKYCVRAQPIAKARLERKKNTKTTTDPSVNLDSVPP